MKTNTHFLSYLARFFLEWVMFQTKVVEKIKTHILYSVTFFENRVFYEIMWKNVVEYGRAQINLAHAHCMDTKGYLRLQTHTHLGCAILIAFPQQRWLHEGFSILRYTYIACLVIN